MIIRINPRSVSPDEPLAEALGRPVSDRDGLTDLTVIARWPGPDYSTPFDKQGIWTSAEWAAHLHAPTRQYPFASSPEGDRRAIWHADVRLHPDDRDLTGPEWSQIAHRIALIAGIQRPGDPHGCRWIAVQARPGRLDLLANLIQPDGIWTIQPQQLLLRLNGESRRIEAELGLLSLRPGPATGQTARFADRSVAQAVGPSAGAADAVTQLSGLLRQLADEHTGPLSTVRGLVEHAAQRLDRLPAAYGPASAHQLELIARRLHGIQQDLDATAAALPTAAPSPTTTHAPFAPVNRRAISARRPACPLTPPERTIFLALADRFLTLGRDVHSGEVLARGGDPEATASCSAPVSSPSSASTRPITACPSASTKTRRNVSPFARLRGFAPSTTTSTPTMPSTPRCARPTTCRSAHRSPTSPSGSAKPRPATRSPTR
ncbi:hypothetical protein [Streptomyces viridochromogenes]|uniref:hypothetical protein n=1 Tax=Streptomyces viridochromogenes TaxID=1938 RepID=UPI000B272982|nr:hypothetical protein [Streptomyces viridochromogenes]